MSRPGPQKNLIGRDALVGESRAIEEVRASIRKYARIDSPVLITGETGTGKEVVAGLIHHNSPRSAGPFVPVNCAALPADLVESELFGHERGAFTGAHTSKVGLMETAAGGTIFLDEMGEMPPPLQAKLLLAIDQRKILRVGGRAYIDLDVRIVSATNVDVEAAIDAGTFREDLYYRLLAVRIDLPPLRDRREDIPLLVAHFLRTAAAEAGRVVPHIGGQVLEHLVAYDWRGNVRQLQHVIETTVQSLDSTVQKVEFQHLPVWVRREMEGSPGAVGDGRTERDWILAALAKTKWNVARAAKKLGMLRRTLYRRLLKYNIRRDTDTEDGG